MTRLAAILLPVLLLVLTANAACTPVVMPAGAASAAPALAADALVMADGTRLPLRRWLPADRSPAAVILALHGFNDYSNFFEAPGTYLAGRGIASYAYDQRGFGGAPNRGLWPGNRTLADDLRHATRLVRARHPGIPLFLVGESMGGAVVMVAMAAHEPPPADAVVLVAPAVWGRASMPWYQNMALWIGAHTFPEGRLTGRGLGIRASDNVEVLKAMGRDPLVIKETRIDAVFGLVGLMDEAMAAAGRVDGRVLVLYGENDELIPEGAIREMLARMPAAAGAGVGSRRVAFYPSGWHMLLRDLQAEVVWKDIAAWIDRPNLPLPSGADGSARTGNRI
jgi:alpha-beta hydrolase superfamily lysophospholipase